MKNIEEFKHHMLSCFPFEGCGFVKDEVFYPCENVADDKYSTFKFSVEDDIRSADADYIVHSHTLDYGEGSNIDPRLPSIEDMERQEATDLPWAIVHVTKTTVSEPVFFGTHKYRPDLYEREFVFNANDCYTFLVDYYWNEYRIDLPVLPRHFDWFQRGEEFIDANWKKIGFYEISMNDAEPGDVILFAKGTRFLNHIGVFLGGDDYGHHELNKLSCVASLSSQMKWIKKVVRHKDKPDDGFGL